MPSPTRTTLERRLGPFDAAAIIVANVIGGGILFTPPAVAAMVPHPIWFLSTWIAGGALAFAGAMAYAELAALRPRAGGEYVYLREAYGPLAGFMTGWTSFVAGFTGAMAASAIFLIFVLDRFIPGVADSTPFFVIPLPYVPLVFSRHTLLAILAIWLFAFVHIRGVGPGRVVMNVLATLKVTGAPGVHRAGVCGRFRLERQPPAGGELGERDELAARAHSGDVHLFGMERGGLHGRGDPRSRTQRAARAADGDDRRHHHLRAPQHAVSLRDAGERACRREGQRVRSHRRAHPRRARRRRPRACRHRERGCGFERVDVRGPARVLRDGSRRRVFPCRRGACTHASGHRTCRSSPRRCGRACSF